MNSQTISLRERTFKAGSWVLIGHLFSQFLRFGGNLILTRLLVPEMFGIMAIVNVILAGLQMFSDVGLLQNIVQSRRGEERDYLNTAWTIQIIRGFLICSVTLIISASLYYLNQFSYLSSNTAYGNAKLPFILAVMSITAAISGFNSIQLSLLNRKLMMGKLVAIEIFSQVVGLGFMIFWAWKTHDIWALVFGTVISCSIKMTLSHASDIGDRCQFCWDSEAVSEIFHFGKWIFGSSIFTFLIAQGDRLILGGLISPEELGVYGIAFFLATAFKEVVKKVRSSVFYPAMSEVARTRPEDLKNVYYRMRSRLDIVVMIVVGGLASTGHVVIDLLYDERYQDAGWMLEILSFSIVFLGTTMAGVCFMALGDSKTIMILTATSTVFLFGTVPIAYNFFGLYGAVVAIALNSVVEIPLILYKMNKYKLLSWKGELKMWPILFLSYGLGRYLLVLIN
ncbi:oligosaccharide flippase family protein [Methylobacter luteus]|uniref:oligosaccharide flippase family protein n=1 Tax=Methylobacter luteus TaxID=415 RepID=UPI0004257820|nr:oligosaccharide flippase family protein [Methylobacter luteus]